MFRSLYKVVGYQLKFQQYSALVHPWTSVLTGGVNIEVHGVPCAHNRQATSSPDVGLRHIKYPTRGILTSQTITVNCRIWTEDMS